MKYIAILAICWLTFTSCSKDNNESLLDNQLLSLLEKASEGAGTSYYMMPNPDDYNNIPQDPNNPLTAKKVLLGKSLFHETAFGTKGKFPITKEEYSCASCHHVQAGFQAGLPQGLGEGGQGFGIAGEGRIRNELCDPKLCDVQPVRSPSVLNGAFQPVMLWNGQFGSNDINVGTEDQWTESTPKALNKLGFEGLETQAIAGLEVHRIDINKEAVESNGYKKLFDDVFDDLPEDKRYTLTTAGLAIAAYERTILAYEAPFQKYLRGNTYQLSDYQKEGAILFFGKANCVACHTGPALNKMEFHALGMNEFLPENVIHYDVNDPAQFGRSSFTKMEADMYQFKTPQLYNLRDVSFLGHGASFNTIREVIDYKNKAIPQNSKVPLSQLSPLFRPLGLSDEEIDKVTAFIKYSLYDPYLDRFVPTSVLSGNCFPNNDNESKIDLDCN